MFFLPLTCCTQYPNKDLFLFCPVIHLVCIHPVDVVKLVPFKLCNKVFITNEKIISFPDDYIISIGMQKAFESLLLEYKVDLAFWAHYHSYERTCPVQLGHCTPGAPVHIVVGTAGKNVDLEDYFPVSWSIYHENNYGYGRLTQANRSALHWEWVENTSGQVKDEVWLTKLSQ